MNSKRSFHIRMMAVYPFLALIYVYKYAISPLMPGGCRHYPSCSVYAVDALKMHGPFQGMALATGRVFRCHPWGTHGIDPVPRYLIKRIKHKKYGVSSRKERPSCDRLKH